MVALTTDRNTLESEGDLREGPVAAATLIYQGSIVMRNNTTGLLTKGATATGQFGVGVALKRADNSGGAASAIRVQFKRGVFRFANSAAGDQIVQADVGKVAWIVDDQTVAKTNGSSTRSPAGIIDRLDATGEVWVRFDEHLIRAS